ncbi:glycoside hydrolase family 20 zincin-like fold domain-containing protein [Streptomyces sp. NBC_00996]|uniref:glycoside hydrolase family 20 zincin-like fold domain-containing protein n=1 Tax=Streptomyces sp. NBC_00996 TaxID=2903710 RepID=UPI00386F1A0C|nr:family 20 glycosylhydrolase [Streptomyces sp. NBC_00996]
MVVVGSDSASAAANPRPLAVPAIQQWTGSPGTFTLTTDSRIVVNTADQDKLSADASTFAADLKTITGLQLPVNVAAEGKAGDIFLRLDTTTTQADEGYTTEVGSTADIRAKTATGVYWGQQTLEQVLKANPARVNLPNGTAIDGPTVAHRGVMLDLGRRYWAMDELKRQIRQMSWHKLNQLHLHFTDNDAFRLQSTTYPGLAPSTGSYSHEDISTLVSCARNSFKI